MVPVPARYSNRYLATSLPAGFKKFESGTSLIAYNIAQNDSDNLLYPPDNQPSSDAKEKEKYQFVT